MLPDQKKNKSYIMLACLAAELARLPWYSFKRRRSLLRRMRARVKLFNMYRTEGEALIGRDMVEVRSAHIEDGEPVKGFDVEGRTTSVWITERDYQMLRRPENIYKTIAKIKKRGEPD